MTERSELLDLVIEETDDKMHKAVEHARAEFSSVRTGRASSALIERLGVEAYDSTLPLQQLASFKVPEARMPLAYAVVMVLVVLGAATIFLDIVNPIHLN